MRIVAAKRSAETDASEAKGDNAEERFLAKSGTLAQRKISFGFA